MYHVNESGVVCYVESASGAGQPAEVVLRTTLSKGGFAYSHEHGLLCLDPSLAKQSFKDECDINVLIERFGIGYQVPQAGIRQPVYADFTEAVDFRSAMDAVVRARESFDALSADVRARFHHDPQEFVAFCGDVKNVDEMGKLGLLDPGRYAARQAELKAAADKVVADAVAAATAKSAPPGGV